LAGAAGRLDRAAGRGVRGCLSNGSDDGIAEWADTACEALAAQGDWGRVANVARRAAEASGDGRMRSPTSGS
jgi:hypothetical protein